MGVLHISGRDFDPAAASRLGPYRVYRVGEPRRRSQPEGARCETSGISVAVSEAAWSDLSAQVSDACQFLDHHAETIRTLKNGGTVEDMRLDFPVDLRIGEGVAAQFEFLPAVLIEKAGALGLGLEISVYPTGDREE